MSSIGTLRDAATGGSPYIGLAYYTQNEAAIFFGRDAERTVLISNLRASRLTLLYAQSGTGKSSLLRAGVAARLGVLARRGLEQRGTAGNIPVVFSSWRDEPTDELIAEIQRSIIPFSPEASPPETTHQRLEEAIDAATTAANATLLVMLDQFEEYLLYRPTEVRSGRFADEVASCINRANLRANFLISIREDAFSGLGDLFQQRIENVYGNYLHLEHLDMASARQAIEKPIACFNELRKLEVPFQIEPGLVDAVLSQLSPDQFVPGRGGIGGLVGGNGAGRHSDEIAAPYLQLVMLRLWDVERAVGSRELRLRTLEELGGARTIIGTYVDRTLGSLPDDDREMAVDVFHHLVTPSGTKIALTASDLAEYTGHSVNETTALLEQLASYKTRILRAIAPLPGREGGTLYEISHDLLARAILDWGRRHRAARLELEKEAAEQQAQTEKKRARRFGKIAIWAAIITVFAIIVASVALSSPGPSSQGNSTSPPASSHSGPSSNDQILLGKIPDKIKGASNCHNISTSFGATAVSQCTVPAGLAAGTIVYYLYPSQAALGTGYSNILTTAGFRKERECTTSGKFVNFVDQCESSFTSTAPAITGRIAEYVNTSHNPIIVTSDNQQQVMVVLVGTNEGDLLEYWKQFQWVVT